MPSRVSLRAFLHSIAIISIVSAIHARPILAAQVDANWIGGSGIWSNGANWSPAIAPSNGVGGNTYRVFIDHGAGAASVVAFDTALQIDTLTLDTGEFLNLNNATLLALVGGSLTNNGTLTINSGGSNTDLRLDADLSLTGTGTLIMSNATPNRIRSDVSTRRLTNASTIRGAGQIGVDSLALTNQGLIQADQSTALSIDPSASGAINTGTLRATNGATLLLSGGSFDNTGGTIDAQNNSTVTISSSLVTAGSYTTSGTGVISLQGCALAGPTNNGQIAINNAQFGVVTGTVTNNATISLNSGGSNTDLRIDSDVSLTGGGTVALSNATPNRIRSDNAALRLTNVNNTIRGSGQLGTDSMALTNQGIVQADQSTPLTIDPSNAGAINTGTLRATAGATLNLIGGVFTNTGGTIQAQAGSNVTLGLALIDSGILATVADGVIKGNQSTLLNVNNTGSFAVNDGALIALQGTMTNTGTISLNSAGSNSFLRMDTDVSLTGNGTIAMSNASPNQITGLPGTNRLTNVNNLIRGSGQICADQLALTNQSVIQADQTTSLTIDPSNSGAINTGTLRATNNATLNLVNGAFTNAGGVIEAQNGSAVSLNFALIDGGTITSSGTGTVSGNQSTLQNVTNTGKFVVPNGSLIALNGTTFTNTNDVAVNSGGSTTILRIDADINLTGGGVVNMSNATPNEIRGLTGALRLTNVNNTIRGSGQIGADIMALTNQSIIQADQPTPLTIDPSATGAINTGTLQATSGGTLNLQSGSFDNSNGTILAQTGSTVNLNSALIANGLLNTSGTGTIFGNSSTLQNVTNSGNFVVPNSQLVALNGTTLNNTGTVTLNSGGSSTYLRIDSPNINLTGGGTVLMSNAAPNQIIAIAPSNRLSNVNNTIRGSGQIGADQLALTNQNLIQADPGTALVIDPSASGAINTGTFRAASGGSSLVLSNGTFDNTGGLIEAHTGSTVSINTSLVVGGVINSAGTGTVVGNSSTLQDVTNNGQFVIPNAQVDSLRGSILNNGSIAVSSGGSNTQLRIDTDVSLYGAGTVTLSNTTPNQVFGTDPSLRLTNYGNVISGGGNIGLNQMALTNWGTIDANVSTGLTIDVTDASTFDNRGQLKVTGSSLTIAPGGFTTSGYVTIDAGMQLIRSGAYTQTGGITLVNGSLTTTSGTNLNGGLLKGNGTVFFGVTNTGGNVLPGTSPGQLTISGGYSQSAGGTLSIELGGLTPVTQHDVLNVVGTATLAGSLRVSPIDGFVPALGQTYVILNATTRTGTFSNIQTFGFPPGLTVQATYSPTTVSLQVITGLGARLGDMNCDNAVTLPDVPLFIEALMDPASFDGNHPGCSVLHADMNSDGAIDARDVQGFARCSTGGPCS